MIDRVRKRATFLALAEGERRRRGSITLVRVDAGSHRAQVAYRVGRRVGNAVTRNRLRRRLRAAVVANAERLDPSSAYLVGAGRGAVGTTTQRLSTDLGVLIDELRPAGKAP